MNSAFTIITSSHSRSYYIPVYKMCLYEPVCCDISDKDHCHLYEKDSANLAITAKKTFTSLHQPSSEAIQLLFRQEELDIGDYLEVKHLVE